MADVKSLAYIVDDEEVIAETLGIILNQSGFEAVAFTDPMEALRAAEKRCPDFLITDVAMPSMNGVDLSIQFRTIYPTCRILLFSGAFSTARRLAAAQEIGFEFTILAKPVHPSELLKTLEQLKHG
jgi:DNA-binding NtrC family response regulator